MRPGRVVALSLLVAVAAAPAAVAEPKRKPAPACHHALRDPAGDTVFGPAGNAFQGLDIVGGRLARGKTELVGVLVMAGDVATDAPTAALGHRWELTAAIRGMDHRFAAWTSGTGGPGAAFSVNGTPRPVTMTIEGRTIVWRVKRADLPAPSSSDKPGLARLAAMTSVAGVTADNASDADKFTGCKP